MSQAGLGNPALTAASWGGELYLGGNFFFNRSAVDYNFIMKWNGSDWIPVPGVDGPVKSIKVIDDQLIVAGWFTYADTVLANGLARWDGSAWHRVVDVPVFSPGNINYVQDVERYEEEWYLGGNLLSSARGLVRYDGTSWETVGGGFLGVFSQVNKLRVHDERLYVAGSFSQCPEHAGVPSNPGSGIVAWDGAVWDDLGGGTCGASNGSVIGMEWWHGELHVAGLFDRIGGQSGHRLAKWDGQQWCMLTPPGFWGTGGPGALAVFNDSLYIGGAFLTAGGAEASCFVKWVGGDYTYSCGTLTGMAEPIAGSDVMSVWPNPVTGSALVSAPRWVHAACVLTVLDAAGRTIESRPWGMGVIRIGEALPAGVYTLRLHDAAAGRVAHARFIRL